MEIEPGGTIGRFLGPNDLRFDLADSGDHHYEIPAATSDSDDNIFLLDWKHICLLRLAPCTPFPSPSPNKLVRPQLRLAAASDGIMYLS